jgi:hypothetical protein
MTGVRVARAVRPVYADPGRIDRIPVPDLCCLWAEDPATPMIIALAGTVEGGVR